MEAWHMGHENPVDYETFVAREAREVFDRYVEVHGRLPAASDLYHNAWRRLSSERWSQADILAGIDPAWTPPAPDPVEPAPGPQPGPLVPLTIAGTRFVRSDGSRFVWRGVTGFRVVDYVAKGDLEAARAYLRWARASGFGGVRTTTTATNPFMDLAPAEGREALPRALALAAEEGLYLQVIALSDTAVRIFDWRQHARDVALICASVPHALYEFANEPFHGRQDQALHDATRLEAFTREATANLPDLLWTCGTGEDDEAAAPVGRFGVRHLDRGRDLLNQVRRVKELWSEGQAAARAPFFNSEPLGADERPGGETGRQRTNEPWFFYALGALGALFGIGSTFHLQAGLETVVPGSVQQACGRAFLEGMAIVADDRHGVGSYRNVGHAGSPVTAASFEDPDGGPIIRSYSFIDGPRGLNVTLTRPARVALTPDVLAWGNGWRPTRTLDEYPHVVVHELEVG
jgi:hypothetical protein